MKRLETKCLTLGLLIDREIRPDLLVHCSSSAVLLSDKQDPSLASDFSCLCKHFLKEVVSAMGMYLKCLHYLMEAFLLNSSSPEVRVFKVWYCKTFL